MALAYRPPGVYVSEVVTPSVSPLIAPPGDLCLVGLTQGYQQRTDQFIISGTTAEALPGLPTNATLLSVLSVKDALDPTRGATDGSGYIAGTDYSVSNTNGTVTRLTGTNATLADGTLVNVTYTYLPSDYFTTPYRLDDLGAIESRYGSAYTSDGTAINSPISYAAAVAFENGAPDVVIQPLFVRGTPGDPTTPATQPTAAQAATLGTWQDTLYNLRAIDDINLIVPIIGQSNTNVTDAVQLSVFQAVQDHMQFQNQQQVPIVGLFGEDATASTTASPQATEATIINHGNILAGRYGGAVAQQSILVNTASFARPLPILGRALAVGGQYVAAALGGMLASFPVSTALTRKQLSGFSAVLDNRTLQQKNTDAANNLLVVEQVSNVVRVRHGLTLDNSNTATREISVVRAKHLMVNSLRYTIDTQIIGQIIADGNAPTVVQTAIIGVLEQLRQNRDLVSYANVDARATSLDPTIIEVRFSYRPAFPLNYVDITFSIDLTSGSVTTSSSQFSTTG